MQFCAFYSLKFNAPQLWKGHFIILMFSQQLKFAIKQVILLFWQFNEISPSESKFEVAF